eukprot:XP_001703577.1 predicted protein [Chlamydomonas reinhardtii]
MACASPDSRAFLVGCLRSALEDADLVDAIAEQAFEAGLTAIAIGSGIISRDALKERLFLTSEEAQSVLDICKQATMTTAEKPANGPHQGAPATRPRYGTGFAAAGARASCGKSEAGVG